MKNQNYFLKGIFFLLFSSLFIVSFAQTQQEKSKYSDIRSAILSGRSLRGQSGPSSVNWIDNGSKYSYIKQNPAANKSEIWEYDPANDKDQLLFNGEGVTFPDTTEPFEYRSFQWAKDSKHLLFQSNFRRIYRRSGISDYYVYSLADKDLKEAAKDARTAELSPDGSMIGYERDGNMYVYDFNSKSEKQLTKDGGKDDYFNGHYDWVYEEEFGQAQAWNWSNDDKYIAYWNFDESPVPIFQMTDFAGLHPEYQKIAYPQVGDPNPKVKIGVVDVKSGKNIWVDTGDRGDFYIPRIYWTSAPNVLAIVVLNRAQNHLKLYFYNVVTEEKKLIMEEKSNAWIDVFDFYGGVNDMFAFPEGMDQFFYISDRDGHQHVYRYAYDGSLINQVTKGDWTATKVDGIDTKNHKIYFESTEVSPTQRQLYSINFDGTDKERITKVEGTHRINLSPNCEYYIDTYSNISTPSQVEISSVSDRMLKKLVDNKSVSEYLDKHYYSPKELFSFTTTDSVKLDCSIIKPYDFDPNKKYPVIFAIYGGPGSQGVYNSFESSSWHQYLAQKGYIIVNVNNRGTANYSSYFMKQVYEQLGKWESNDFVETAKYLSTLPYVDKDNMGIMGTSYGGYSTCYTMVNHPGVFKVGIANSPVTDWRLYDDIYTERYMGLLSENEQGYISSSPTTNAGKLNGHLLLIHSDLDDNVHVQNTMQLLTAFANAGKDFDLRIFPPGAHGAAYNMQSYLLIQQIYYNYLDRWLNGGKDQIDINK